MSANVVIRESNNPYLTQGVGALLLENADGSGKSRWVQGVDGSRLQVVTNGTYRAIDLGADFFGRVSVNVPGGVPTATMGNNVPAGAHVNVGGPTEGRILNDTTLWVTKNGILREYEVDYSIRVSRPPRKLAYHDGEAIDYTGLEVRLVDQFGDYCTTEWYPMGVIPPEELILPVTTAKTNQYGVVDVSSLPDLATALKSLKKVKDMEIPVYSYMVLRCRDKKERLIHVHEFVAGEGVMGCIRLNYSKLGRSGHTSFLYFAKEGGRKFDYSKEHWTYRYDEEQPHSLEEHEYPLTSTYKLLDNTVWYRSYSANAWTGNGGTSYSEPYVEENPFEGITNPILAYGMAFGVYSDVIPVRWMNPYVGRIAETRFKVAITT